MIPHYGLESSLSVKVRGLCSLLVSSQTNQLPGPYAPSILRFQISFPPTYPALPPLVTFATDIFHPLITPLTTYMYSTDIQNTGTVSATDEERLPPGGFSLRHGFPHWFGRASRRAAERLRQSDGHLQTPARGGQDGARLTSPDAATSGSLSPSPGAGGVKTTKPDFGVYEVLRYIRTTFDTEEVLNNVPLEAAGNPGAWHAWRTHQIKLGKITPKAIDDEEQDDEVADETLSPSSNSTRAGSGVVLPARSSGEWNWDGVWEVRVKKGVEGSISEAVLYGSQPSDDLVRFLHMQVDEVDTIKDNIRRSVEAQALGKENFRRSFG